MSSDLRKSIISALAHPEGEEGLYLENFYHLHEEDERPKVHAGEMEILEELRGLIDEGRVVVDESGEQVVFRLK